MISKLVLENGLTFEGKGFGIPKSTAGEIVFNTGMVGYAESMTDPSYSGQILVFTYPLIGNYGIPAEQKEKEFLDFFESDKIHTKAIVINTLSEKFSHWNSEKSLHDWMVQYEITGISGIDTRYLTKSLRNQGSMLAKIIVENRDVPFYNPNLENLVAQVSISEPVLYESTGNKTIVLVDCGLKYNIIRSFLKRGVHVLRVPWDYDFTKEKYDGIMVSNGPGDPGMIAETAENLRKAFEQNKPIFGICLGHQLLSIAAGAKTYKLKFGHRSQNQPCIQVGTKRCYITSQNHGYAVDPSELNSNWKPYFFNANDGSNEGICHVSKPFFSVQFHPEATPGPVDTEFLFENFINQL